MYDRIVNNDFIYTTRYEKPIETMMIQLYLFGNKFFSKLGNILFSLKINDICIHFDG